MRMLLWLWLLIPLGAHAGEDSPEAAVSALWRALSHDPGRSADVATLRRLFHADAVIFGGRYKDGQPALARTAIADFLESSGQIGEKGFYECEVQRSIQAYDRFAVAYSIVESRRERSAVRPDLVGVNSVQLYKDGAQWKILSLYYHVEKSGQPIPLTRKTAGRCMG